MYESLLYASKCNVLRGDMNNRRSGICINGSNKKN